MNTSVNTDDVIFNFFKQICDEKNDTKCVQLGKEWIKAMETNLSEMEKNLNGADKLKHKDDIQNNRDHLNSLKNKNSAQAETIEEYNLDTKEMEFLKMNLYYGHKCRRSFINVKGFTVGTEDYKKCVLRKGRKE